VASEGEGRVVKEVSGENQIEPRGITRHEKKIKTMSTGKKNKKIGPPVIQATVVKSLTTREGTNASK